jgi:predicted branched-subunit amino acid permease
MTGPMITAPSDNSTVPPCTWPGFSLGMRLALPVLPGMMAFGLAVGATTARKGFSFLDNLLMNVIVYAGMSQLVAIESWPEHMTGVALTGLAILSATVNARLLLMAATLRPWLGGMPAVQIYPALHLLTDPGWLIAMRYRADGGSDAGVFLGSSVLLYVAWLSAVSAGYLGGALVSDPHRFGIDLVMPIFFVAMLIPLWRGARRAVSWLAAGIVALLVQQLVGGWWFIVAGAVAGSVTAGFLDDVE